MCRFSTICVLVFSATLINCRQRGNQVPLGSGESKQIRDPVTPPNDSDLGGQYGEEQNPYPKSSKFQKVYKQDRVYQQERKQLRCTKLRCPKVEVELFVNGSRRSEVTAVLGQNTTWRLSAEPYTENDRDFAIIHASSSPKPQRMQIVGLGTMEVIVTWMPVVGEEMLNGVMTVIVRDLSACLLVEKDVNICRKFDSYQMRYDTQYSLTWRVDYQRFYQEHY